eukprot:GAHX01000977.1.p2 GENE.GAHX01000977.1~~GAHX01000977.1.p2  ORF type:complete len:162 (-),score=20.57 GAHX01000977.1:41-526(-)
MHSTNTSESSRRSVTRRNAVTNRPSTQFDIDNIKQKFRFYSEKKRRKDAEKILTNYKFFSTHSMNFIKLLAKCFIEHIGEKDQVIQDRVINNDLCILLDPQKLYKIEGEEIKSGVYGVINLLYINENQTTLKLLEKCTYLCLDRSTFKELLYYWYGIQNEA